MKKRKKRKKIRFVSKRIRGFIPQEVNRRAVRRCLTVHLFFCGGKYVLVGFLKVADVVYCFIDGCRDSMAFCVSHTFFISSLTSFTSAE